MSRQLSTLLLTPGLEGADGLSRLARGFAAALAETGGVEVWSLMDRGEEVGEAGRLRVRRAGADRVRYLNWGLREGLRRQVGRTVIVLHTHLAPVILPLVARGARIVHVIVGVESWRPFSTLEGFAVHRAQRLLSISRHSALEFERFNPGFAGRDVVVCHPGLPDETSAEPIESAGAPFALIVGRMAREERYKGHDVLLDTWSNLQARLPAARLVVVGGGDDRERLETKAKELALEDRVNFTGRLSDEELFRLYRQCSLFVLPSAREGFGFVFLEAMRAAKPCIAANGAAAEIIVDGKTGFVIDPGDAMQLARALEKLFTNPSLASELGRRGRERFLSRFTEAHFRERLKRALAEGR